MSEMPVTPDMCLTGRYTLLVPEIDSKRIRDTLLYLQGVQPDVFGADVHRFQLNPPRPEADVLEFEVRHGVTLPREYREFLIDIGDGGAGPFYGIFPLGEVDSSFKLRVWEEFDVGVLSEPFPFEQKWNDLSAMPHELVNRDESEYWKQWKNSRGRIGALPW
jgi:hypothetical protein